MNNNEKRYSQWTVETLKEHFDALQEKEHAFQVERDRRYSEQDAARSTALEAALKSIEKATDLLASAYRSDKAAQNEWRGTINDIMSKMGGVKVGTSETYTNIRNAVLIVVALGSFIVGHFIFK